MKIIEKCSYITIGVFSRLSSEDKKDLRSEVMLKAWKLKNNYLGKTEDELYGYISTIMINYGKNYTSKIIKKNSFEERLDDLTSEISNFEDYSNIEFFISIDNSEILSQKEKDMLKVISESPNAATAAKKLKISTNKLREFLLQQKHLINRQYEQTGSSYINKD